MKVFDHLVSANLNFISDLLLDPMEFALTANRLVDDEINVTLHLILQHLDRP